MSMEGMGVKAPLARLGVVMLELDVVTVVVGEEGVVVVEDKDGISPRSSSVTEPRSRFAECSRSRAATRPLNCCCLEMAADAAVVQGLQYSPWVLASMVLWQPVVRHFLGAIVVSAQDSETTG